MLLYSVTDGFVPIVPGLFLHIFSISNFSLSIPGVATPSTTRLYEHTWYLCDAQRLKHIFTRVAESPMMN